MKIFTKNKVYVQINDLIWLNLMDLAIPKPIKDKLFLISYKVISGNINRYEFVNFEDINTINFFREIDWILDYDEVKDLTFIELLNTSKNIEDKANIIVRSYNLMNQYDKIKNHHLKQQHEYLNIKWFAVRDFILFKYGILKFNLPNEVTYNNRMSKRHRKTLMQN